MSFLRSAEDGWTEAVYDYVLDSFWTIPPPSSYAAMLGAAHVLYKIMRCDAAKCVLRLPHARAPPRFIFSNARSVLRE